MKLHVANWRLLLASLALSAVVVAPAFAGRADSSVRDAIASGKTARVILQYASTAERDAAFNRLLDRGAAVRAVDTEAGPALVVLGSPAAFGAEVEAAAHASLDAGVSVLAQRGPARGTWSRSENPSRTYQGPFNGNGNRNGYAVAIIDSGFTPHADLPLSRVRFYKDFVTGGRTPVDNCGHGTHVAGIVAGSGLRSNGAYAGIAPHADIIPLRVLGDDCSGNTSDVIDALEWVNDNYIKYNIGVVNISLGHAVLESIFTDPLMQAVERVSRKGVVVVTAAGNKGINPVTGKPGYGGVGVPCNAPSAVCVGSLDTKATSRFSDDRVSDSSSRGPTRFDLLAKPDLVAPGVNIVSLAAPGSRLFTEFADLRVEGSNHQPEYFTLSGTSMASPAVAGAAVLLLGQNGALTANTIKMSLQFTARIVKKTDVLTQGAGALNVGGALTLAGAINPNARLGRNWITHPITAANRDASGQVIAWGQRIIYGDRFMQPRYAQIRLFRWSDDIVWAYDAIEDNIVWGNDESDNIVWGNSDDDNIVWGNITRATEDNIVWGNNVDNIVWGNCSEANDDNIVWGNNDDNIVWGNSVLTGGRR